jgi:transcription initiation factor TFIID subunit 3
MSSTSLFLSLLRPSILHILRASGFHGARPTAAESLIDIAARYMLLIAQKTAEYAWVNHNDTVPNITDLRMALEDIGALTPQMIASEEQLYYDDDLRGVENFIAWIEGDTHKEIRRIAGLESTAGDVNIDLDAEREDFLTGETEFLYNLKLLTSVSFEKEAQQNWRRI